MFKFRVPVTCTLPHAGRRLANGATLIVVEDREITKPAAAMAFAVGKNNDPSDFPGLAHFCEHMLFMGTAKYPSEDAYHTAVKRNGGSCNAYTSNDITAYHFTSSLDSFKTVVDMFLEFFVAPSFNASAVDREINAVNSEDERNHTQDGRRVEEMYKSFVVAQHPRSRYGSGNTTTLKTDPESKGLDLHEALRTFFATNYVAEASCLVVQSPYPADEVLALVEPALLRLRSGPVPPSSFVPRGEVLLPNTTGTWCNALSTSKSRSLQLKWVLPYGLTDFKLNPGGYLSHMVGHEVKGTILAALRAKGLGTSLSSGDSSFDGENLNFSVSITLTDKGLANLTAVIDLVFMYLEFLRRNAPDLSATFKEMLSERLTRFEFREVPSASSHCSHLAANTVLYGPDYAFSGGSLCDSGSVESEMVALTYLTPERCVFVLSAGEETDFAAAASANAFVGDTSLDKTTRFHKLRYSVAPIPSDILDRWSSKAMASAELDPLLHLPEANPFLSDDFTVYGPPSPSKAPTRIDTQYGFALVKRNEAHLMQPKLYATLTLLMTNNTTVGDKYYREVMVSALNEALTDTLYFASLAGLTMVLSSGASGLVMVAAGPSSGVPTTLLTVLERVLDRTMMLQSEEVFNRYHKRKQLALKTTYESQPSELGAAEMSYYFSSVSRCSWWSDTYEFSKTATYEGYCAYVNNLLSAARSEVVVDGNLESLEHIKASFIDKIDAILAKAGLAIAAPTDIPQYNDFYTPNPTGNKELYLINLPPFSQTNVNAFASVRLNLGPASPDRLPLLRALSNVIGSPFFNTLRSTEALGYAVSARLDTNMHRQASIVFSAQSPVVPPLYLYSRIHAFIDAFEAQLLASIPEADLSGTVKGIVQSLKQLTVSVAGDGQRIAADRHCPYGFDWREQEIVTLENGVTRDQLLELYHSHISNDSLTRSCAVVMVHSSKLPEVIDYSQPVQLPPARQMANAAQQGAVADIRLQLSTFEAESATSVSFRLLGSKAEAHAASTYHPVPHI